MGNINWDAIEEEYGANDFKQYAPTGKYDVKLGEVEFKQAGSKGNYVVKFKFDESDDYKFPTADHWLVKDKQNWRIKHMKDLMMVLGCTEENAKKACEIAESKDSFDYAVQGYEKAFTALAKKKPSVEIEIYPDGKYSRAEFTDRRVAMKRDDSPLTGAEEVTLDTADELDMPF